MTTTEVIAIHRGRNHKTTVLFKSQTSRDYNFDYRGLVNRSLLGPLFLYIKAYITSLEIPPAKIYLVEGTQLAIVAFFLKRRYRGSKIAVLLNGPEFQWDEEWSVFKKFRFRMRMHSLRKFVDLFLPISQIVENDVKRHISPTVRCEIISPFLFEADRFEGLIADCLLPALCFVIERPDDTGHVKGLDRVWEIFAELKKVYPSASLTLIGSGTEQFNDVTNGIYGLGFRRPEEVLTNCCIILSPARYEAFNLSIAEGILCGLVPLVSRHVGARDIIERVTDRFTVSNDSTALWVEKIIQLLQEAPSERIQLLQQLQREIRSLSEPSAIRSITEAINSLK